MKTIRVVAHRHRSAVGLRHEVLGEHMKRKLFPILLVVLSATAAFASHQTIEYKNQGFSVVLPIRTSPKLSTDEDGTFTLTYDDGMEPWQMRMVVVFNGVDYSKTTSHKLLEDFWASTVSKKTMDPIGPIHFDKDAAGNERGTFEMTLHTPASDDANATDTHVTMRFVAVVGSSRFYEISVLRNFGENVDDFDFINSFKLLP